MPSFGRIKKFSVLGVAVAALGVTASGASAATNDVWVWACHGPGSQEVGDYLGNSGSSNLASYGVGCTSDADLAQGGLRGVLEETDGKIAYGSVNANLVVPPGTQLSQLRLLRRASGIAPGIVYEAKRDSTSLESASGVDVSPYEQVFNFASDSPLGGSLQLSLRCTLNPCAANNDATLDVARIGMKLVDTAAPQAAVGGFRNPAAGVLELDFAASDVGIGLRYAEAWIDGGSVQRTAFRGDGCDDLTDGDSTVDLRFDAVASPGGSCVKVGHALVKVDTAEASVGDREDHTLTTRVVDWAGNEWTRTEPLAVNNHVNLGTDTQTLSIGTSGTPTPNANANNNSGAGGVAGATAQSCRSPRLSFSLSQKPMRVSKGVPVLQYGKRYRFNGRLTCVINGKRKAAPKRARVDITNKVGKKTLEKAGTTVRDKGRLTVILSYKSSRSISFRFTSTSGQRSTVTIKVKVEKKKSSRR